MDAPADLASGVDFLSVGGLLKATPSEDGGRRFIYMEAAKEGVDLQGEVVLAKALEESAPYYLRYGNLDVDHYTRIGARLGIPKYSFYEIGQPREVGRRGGSIFVKAEVYTGAGDAAEQANTLWKSMTDVRPAQRWYPSVGGAVLGRRTERDRRTGEERTYITGTRWSNIGLSKTPVNQHVSHCGVIPMGTFAKSLTACGELDLTKALSGGGSADPAAMTGGRALQAQSMDPATTSYWHVRHHLARAINEGHCGQDPTAMTAWVSQHHGLSRDAAAHHVERFFGDLRKATGRKTAA